MDARLNREVVTSMIRMTGEITFSAAELLKSHGLTLAQFNVLRILRGAGDSLTCSEISARMLTRDSDITRLLDRLENQNLIARSRDKADRRVVRVNIRKEGLLVLSNLDKPVEEWEEHLLRNLTNEKKRQLADYLSALSTN